MRYQCDARSPPDRKRATFPPADSLWSTRGRDSPPIWFPYIIPNHEYRYLDQARNTRYLLFKYNKPIALTYTTKLQVNLFYKIKHNHTQTYTHNNIQSCSSPGPSMTLLETWALSSHRTARLRLSLAKHGGDSSCRSRWIRGLCPSGRSVILFPLLRLLSLAQAG